MQHRFGVWICIKRTMVTQKHTSSAVAVIMETPITPTAGSVAMALTVTPLKTVNAVNLSYKYRAGQLEPSWKLKFSRHQCVQG